MKRLFILSSFLLLNIVTNAQPTVTSESGIKLRLRHHQRHGLPDCVGGGSGCTCPLGICITSNFVDCEPANCVLTPAEIADDWGTGTISIVQVQEIFLDPPNNTVSKKIAKIKIVFNQLTATAEGDIPFNEDWYISEDVSSKLGYTSIKVFAGSYQVMPSPNSNFGEAYLSCQLYN